MGKIFTTGQVAQIAQVAPRTVSRWCDTGRLTHYKVPGSKDRRIPSWALTQFFRQHGWDHIHIADKPCVLLVTPNESLIHYFNAALRGNSTLKLVTALDCFSAGLHTYAAVPDCLVIETLFGTAQVWALCGKVRHMNEKVRILALAPGPRLTDKSVVDETFIYPFDPALLVERVKTLAHFLWE